jgi:hypothetical protein
MKKKIAVCLMLLCLVVSTNNCFWIASDGCENGCCGFATFLMLAFLHPGLGCNVYLPGSDPGNQPSRQWAFTAKTGPDASGFYSTSADGDGIYAAGYITGNRLYDFGTNERATGGYEGGTNALLVKYEAGGGALWAATASTAPDNTCFYSVSSGTDGVYAAGTIDGNESFIFGNSVIVSGHYASGTNVLLVKYDRNGTPLWARSVTAGPDASSYNAVSAGCDGIYVSGCIMGNSTYDFGNGVTATGNGTGSNALVVKYDRNGTPLWARSVVTGPNDSSYLGIASGGEYVFAAGFISGDGTYDFGDARTVSGTYDSGPNAVMVKYSSSGTVHWVKSVSKGANGSSFQSVALAGEKIYAAGYITGISLYDFGNGKIVTGGGNGSNALLVQYSIPGSAQWARSVTSSPEDSFYSSVAAGSDYVCAAGFISGKLPYNFGNAWMISGAYESGPNALLVKYNTSGTTQYAKTALSGHLESFFDSVAATSDGVYAAGSMFGTLPYDFGNGLSLSGDFTGSNCVLVKY